MHDSVTLKLGGSCRAIIHFTSMTKDKKSIKSYIELWLPEVYGGGVLRSIENNILIEDWESLCQYLEKHIAAQQVSYPEDSILFLTYDLQFKLQAFAGSVASNTEGTFSLSFMVNIGADPITSKRIFAGVEVRVLVSDVREFIASLRGFLSEVIHDGQSGISS